MKRETINPGNFLESITWMQPTAEKDKFGQTRRTFAEDGLCFAQVLPVSLEEMPIAGRVQYSTSFTFTTYNNSAVNSKYQVKWNEETYNILRIETLNNKTFMRVTAAKEE